MPSGVAMDGAYRPDSGDVDEAGPAGMGTLDIDPKSVRGLESYRPGDTVNLTVKAKYPEQGGSWVIVSAMAEDMEEGVRATRMREDAGIL